jgi:DNA-binding beta-propeller fold protein YncE
VAENRTTKQAEVLAEYGPFPGVDHIHGVTHDGHDAWIAVGDRLQAVAPDGTLGRSLPVRAQAGTAFDGRHLYQIADGRIQKVDPATGNVLAIVPAPPSADYAGLTWAEGALWVAQYQGRRILKIDPDTGRVLRTVQSDRLITGVTFADGDLWHGSIEGGQGELRRVDAQSGEVLDALAMPGGAYVSGLEYGVVRRPKR